MKQVITGDNTTFVINDLFDRDGWEFIKMTIKENLFEGPASIKIDIHADELPANMNEEFTGYILDVFGNKIEFRCYLDQAFLVNKTGQMTFLCCHPKFIKDIVTTKYESIDNAIQSTWQYDIRKTPKDFQSDIMSMNDSNYFYYEPMCTNMALCSKLVYCYKKYAIAGYTLGDLVMIDLGNYTPVAELSELAELTPEGSPCYMEPKFYQQDSEIIDYSGGVDPNHKLIKYYNKLISVDNAYVDVIGNTLYNRRFDNPIMSNTYSCKKFTAWKLGDAFKIYSENYTLNEPRLVARSIEINDNGMNTLLTFNCYK